MIEEGGGEGGKNVVWEQIKAMQWRLDRRRGGVGTPIRHAVYLLWQNIGQSKDFVPSCHQAFVN